MATRSKKNNLLLAAKTILGEIFAVSFTLYALLFLLERYQSNVATSYTYVRIIWWIMLLSGIATIGLIVRYPKLAHAEENSPLQPRHIVLLATLALAAGLIVLLKTNTADIGGILAAAATTVIIFFLMLLSLREKTT